MTEQAKATPLKILDRIRKCLNLADSSKGATEDEAAAAMAAAKRLMAEYNLSMSDVEVKEEASHGANSNLDSVKRKDRPVWESYLARVADELFGTKHYFTSVPHPKGRGFVRRVMFVGVGQDSQIASESFSTLVDMVWKMAYSHEYAGREHKSYCLGVVRTLLERAKDKVQDSTPAQEERGRGIMVVKNQVIDQHLATLGLRNARKSNMSINGAAYAHGQRDGRTVNMGFRNALR